MNWLAGCFAATISIIVLLVVGVVVVDDIMTLPRFQGASSRREL